MSNRIQRRCSVLPPWAVRVALLLVLVIGCALPAAAVGDDAPSAGSDSGLVLGALSELRGVVQASNNVVASSDADSALVTSGADAASVDVPVDPSASVTVDGASGSSVGLAIPNADGAGDAQVLAPGIAVYPDVAPAVDVAVQALPAEAGSVDVQPSVFAASVPVVDTAAVEEQAQAAGSDAAAAAAAAQADPAASSPDSPPPAAALPDVTPPAAGPDPAPPVTPPDAASSSGAPDSPSTPVAPPVDPGPAPEVPGQLNLFSLQWLEADPPAAPAAPADAAAAPAAPADPAAQLAATAPATVDVSQAPEIPAVSPLALGLGVRFLTVIAGPDAPSDYSFPVSVPDGGSIEQLGQSFLISDADGVVVAMVPPPWAKDANGVPLPISYSLDGTTVQVHVDFSQAEFPVVLDPKVADAGASARAAAAAAEAARVAAANAAAARARAEAEARAAAAAKAQAEAQARARAAAEAAARAAAEQRAREVAAAAAREKERQAAEARAKADLEAYNKRQAQALADQKAAAAKAAAAKAAAEKAAAEKAAAAKAQAAAVAKGCTLLSSVGAGIQVGGCIGSGTNGEPCTALSSATHMCISTDPKKPECAKLSGLAQCIDPPSTGITDQCQGKQSNACLPAPLPPSCDLLTITSKGLTCTGNDKPLNCPTGKTPNTKTGQCEDQKPTPCPDGTPRQSVVDTCSGATTKNSDGLIVSPPAEGPGTWDRVNESMSDRARRYQEQITGVVAGWVYTVAGVKFDGYKGGTLIEAKGPGYDWMTSSGAFLPTVEAGPQGIAQGQRQVTAAGGRPIVWYVAEPDVAKAYQALFLDAHLPIQVVSMPPVG